MGSLRRVHIFASSQTLASLKRSIASTLLPACRFLPLLDKIAACAIDTVTAKRSSRCLEDTDMLSRCWYLALHTSCTTVLYGKLADTEDHAYQLAFPQFGVMQGHQKQTTEHIFQECPLLAEAKQPSPAELCEKGKPQTRKAEKHAGQRCRDVLLAVVFVELAVHRSARLYFNEVMDRPILRSAFQEGNQR
jgi:hypothetical protein